MKKTFFKYFFLSLSLCSTILLFLNIFLFDEFFLHVLEEMFIYFGTQSNNFHTTIEPVLTTFNNVFNVLVLMFSFGCFLTHTILLDTTKKKKVLLCVLEGIIFCLVFLAIDSINPAFTIFYNIVSKLFNTTHLAYLYFNLFFYNLNQITSNIHMLSIVIMLFVLLINYLNIVKINKKFKLFVEIYANLFVVIYVFCFSISTFYNSYLAICTYFYLPHPHDFLQELGVTYSSINFVETFILQKFIYILPYTLILLLLVTFFIATFISFIKNFTGKSKKLSFLLLIPGYLLLSSIGNYFILLMPGYLLISLINLFTH